MANSAPMAPDPMMMTDFGSFSCRMASPYVTTCFPSTFQALGTAALAPVAMMMLAAFNSVTLLSEPVTVRVSLDLNLASPMCTATLFFFIRKPTPFVRRSEFWRERFTATP